MNTRKLRKAILTLCSALLLVSLSAGITLAYLTSETAVVKNTFTTGKVEITLNEADVYEDGDPVPPEKLGTEKPDAERVTENKYKLYPGMEYDKDPTIWVDEASEDCYIAAKVTVTTPVDAEGKDLTDVIGYTANGNEYIGFGHIVSGGVFANTLTGPAYTDNGEEYTSDTVRLIQNAAVTDGNKTTHTFYILFENIHSAKNSEVLFTNIAIPDDWGANELALLNNMDISIIGYAVQSTGMDGCEEAMNEARYFTLLQ